jgi:hypothetical protein
VRPGLGSQLPALSCPSCACEQARADYAAIRSEYRTVHAKVSTRGPRLMILAGFGAAGIVAGIATYTYIYAASAQTDSANRRRIERTYRTVMGIGVAVPLGVGIGGLSWWAQRKTEGKPYVERDAELKVALQDARRAQRDACRARR